MKYDLTVGELVIQDTQSKYGTHILIQRPIQLHVKKPVYVVNKLSLIKLELKTKRFPGLCGCLFGNKKEVSYSDDSQFLYPEVAQHMPQDLERYSREEGQIPKAFLEKEKEQFKGSSVHLLPIILENAFYVKDQCPEEEDYSRVNSEISEV